MKDITVGFSNSLVIVTIYDKNTRKVETKTYTPNAGLVTVNIEKQIIAFDENNERISIRYDNLMVKSDNT